MVCGRLSRIKMKLYNKILLYCDYPGDAMWGLRPFQYLLTHISSKMINGMYEEVENQYLESGDFNGYPVYRLLAEMEIDTNTAKQLIHDAIVQDRLEAVFGNVHPNPHIKAFSNVSKDDQLNWLGSEEFPGGICLYPHPEKLKDSNKILKYKASPYSYALAAGAGQLEFRNFDLSVLEFYRNDPRYSYDTDYIHGKICIKDEHYDAGSMPEHDQVLLETFGFSYDDKLNRYVAVFLRYLDDLSPEHQRIWAAKEVKDEIKLHPDYYETSIQGSWGTRMSIFEAFVQELDVINKMAGVIGKPNLFHKSYSDKRPKEFGFLLRPTVAAFNEFILLLDKMMSDNINKKFFEGDIPLEIEEERKDGKIIVRNIGTIQLLENWVSRFFRAGDQKPIEEMISAFKEVRKLRQKPAHRVNPNEFDQELFKMQRAIVIKAYESVRTLRQMLANHPAVKKSTPEISEQLFKGEIWDI